MNNTKSKKIFIEGPITPEFIAKSIASHQSKHNIGAHQIFLGQIRADSLGIVHAGEINLFVFVSSPHRKESSDACGELVEMIKGKLPVWGKILYEDESHTWKVNQ